MQASFPHHYPQSFPSWSFEIAKYYARKEGWYAVRRAYQKQFIIFVASGLSFSLFLLVYFFNKIIYENILAILGLFLLFAFIAIRASSFHHMDSFISYEIFI